MKKLLGQTFGVPRALRLARIPGQFERFVNGTLWPQQQPASGSHTLRRGEETRSAPGEASSPYCGWGPASR